MGEDLAQAERSQPLGSGTWQEKPASPSLAPSSTPSPSLTLGSAEEALRDGAQVNAVTVLTLLDKLVHMLDAVQENQHHMEQRQISLEGSVKGIQNDLTKLSKYQACTGNTVSKLLQKSRKVSAHTRAVKERLDRQSAQVRRLEANHAQLLRRNHFKVLIFQEENEIPASVFVKEPAPGPAADEEELAEESKSPEETLHAVDLSSSDESPLDEEALQGGAEEKTEESRAERIKRSSLQKVDSLKKAFSRRNIEKKMNKLGTKIVSVERREKIRKSLTANHQKLSAGQSSPFKASPLAFRRKKGREGQSPAGDESRSADAPGRDPAPDRRAEGLAETSPPGALAEGTGREGGAGRAASRAGNIDVTIEEDEEEPAVAVEQAQKVHYEGGDLLPAEDAADPGPPAVLPVDQSA